MEDDTLLPFDLPAAARKTVGLFCDCFERVPSRIVPDIDDTEDAVCGGRQLALLDAYYVQCLLR